MKIRSAAYIVVLLAGCAHTPSEPIVAPKSNTEYKIVNMGPEFVAFWEHAEGRAFDVQLRLWDKMIEQPHQAFYDILVWQKSHRPGWQAQKTETLRKNFAFYAEHSRSVIDAFERFDETLRAQLRRFKKTFADAHFPITIYAAASPTFNGKTGFLPSEPERQVLAFGVDKSLLLGDDPDVLYSHELFHIYHIAKLMSAMPGDDVQNVAKLTLPLWTEGLATLVSLRLNPEAGSASVLMSQELAQIGGDDYHWMVSRFVDQAEEKAFNPDTMSMYQSWFGTSGQSIRADLPHRCGYLVGLRVAERVATNHSFEDMLQWDLDQIHRALVDALHQEAAGRRGDDVEEPGAPERMTPQVVGQCPAGATEDSALSLQQARLEGFDKAFHAVGRLVAQAQPCPPCPPDATCEACLPPFQFYTDLQPVAAGQGGSAWVAPNWLAQPPTAEDLKRIEVGQPLLLCGTWQRVSEPATDRVLRLRGFQVLQ